MVPPACEKIQRMSRNFCALPEKTMSPMVRVVSVPHSISPGGSVRTRLTQQSAVGRMGIDDDLAPVEFFHDRQEGGIAEPLVVIVRHQADAVELERVERVGDFLQAAVDVGEREHREAPEAAGMVGDQLCGVFVALAHQLARCFAGSEIDARLRHREHRDRDARLVHIGQRFFRRPAPHQAITEIGADRRRDVARRRQMMVNIDAVGLCRRRSAPWRSADAQPRAATVAASGHCQPRIGAGSAPRRTAKGCSRSRRRSLGMTSACCHRVRSSRPSLRSFRTSS